MPYETLFTILDELPSGKQLALKARINRQGLLEDIERYQSSFSNLDNEEKKLAEEIKQLNIKLSDVLLNKEDSQKLNRKKIKLEEKLYSKLPSLKPRIIEIQEITNLLPKNSALIEFQKYRSLEINKGKNSSSNDLGDYKYIALILKSDENNLKKAEDSSEGIQKEIDDFAKEINFVRFRLVYSLS